MNSNNLETATIKSDGYEREGRDGEAVAMYGVETVSARFWFEVYYDYADNGNDFRVTVRNFGLLSKHLGGATNPIARRKFSVAEAKTAKARLNALFLGPHDNPDLPLLPFRIGKGRCLSVELPDGWIVVHEPQSSPERRS